MNDIPCHFSSLKYLLKSILNFDEVKFFYFLNSLCFMLIFKVFVEPRFPQIASCFLLDLSQTQFLYLNL